MKFQDTTAEQRRAIAKAMGGRATENSLRHVAKGRRGVSAEMAVAIERAAGAVGLDIRRESLSPTCAGCEFARTCRKLKSL